MELVRTVTPSVNISSEVEVLSYTYSGTKPIEVISRVDLGNASEPIVGGIDYLLAFYIDDVLISPESLVSVPAAATRTIMVSRAIALESGDRVSVRVRGAPGDTSVTVVATLRDSTPVLQSDILGVGEILVDHDYPTTDNMRATTPDGVGIQDVDIKAFLTSEYDAGLRSGEAIRGQTKTDVNGRWIASLSLDAGNYTFVFARPGKYIPANKIVEVS